MLTLKVTDELNKLLSGLKGFTQKELETIAIKTINDAAYDARYRLQKEMRQVFQNPTPYTINTLRVYPMRNITGFARVGHDALGKGNDPERYLRPQIYGGPRKQTRSEARLQTVLQIQGERVFLTPASGAKLNQYGNVAPSKYVEVLSYFKAFNQSGFVMNRSKRSTARKGITNKFFMVTGNDPNTAHLSKGIYERTRGGKGFKKIFHFAKQPTYKPRYDFYRIGLEYAASKFRENFVRQVDKIVANLMRQAA